MANIIEHPTLGLIEFPEGMGDNDIKLAVAKLETQASGNLIDYTLAIPPVSTLTGKRAFNEMTVSPLTPERQAELAAQLARYGPPLAAGIATGGAGLLPMMAAGAGASLIGETGAQVIETESGLRQNYSPGAIAGATLTGATPFKGTGTIASRMAVNVPSALATSEAERYLTNPEEYSIPKLSDGAMANLTRFLPVSMAGLGSMVGGAGEKLENIQARVSQIQSPTPVTGQGRLLDTAQLGGRGALFSDIFPTKGNGLFSRITNPAAAERLAIRAKNPKALQQLEEAMSNPTAALEVIRQQKNTRDLSEAMRERLGTLEPLVAKQAASADEAARLFALAEDMRTKGLAGFDKTLEQAKEAALAARTDQVIANLAKERLFGKEVPSVQSVAPSKMVDQAKAVAKDIKDIKSTYVTTLYTVAGVGQDDVVASVSDLLNAVKGNYKLSKDAKEGFEQFLKDRYSVKVGNKTVLQNKPLSLAEYRRVRDEMTKGYVVMGANQVPLQKQFNEASIYDSLSQKVDKNLRSILPEERYVAFKKANRLNNELDNAVKGDLVAKLENGDWSAFSNDFVENGLSGLHKDAEGFITALKNAGQDVWATELGDSLNKLLSNSLLSKFSNQQSGMPRSIRSFDLEGMTKELQQMANNGVPIQKLNFGPLNGTDFRDSVKRLTRLYDTKGNKMTGYSPLEIDKYLKDTAELGQDLASARLQYRRELRSQLLQSESGRKLTTATEKFKLAKAAKLDAADQQAIINDMLANDPLLALIAPSKQFPQGRTFKVSQNPTKNGNFVANIRSAPTEDITSLKTALINSGRIKELEDLQLSFVADLMSPRVTGEVTPNLKTIVDDLNDQDYLKKLQALVSPAEYDQINKNLFKPLKELYNSTKDIGDNIPLDMNTLRAQIGTIQVSRGLKPNATMSLGNLLTGAVNIIGSKSYNLLHMLYLNPKTAPVFAAAGGDLNKFLQQPTMAIAYRLAANRDAQVQQEQAQREQQQSQP